MVLIIITVVTESRATKEWTDDFTSFKVLILFFRHQSGAGLLCWGCVWSGQRVRLLLQRPRQDRAGSADRVLHCCRAGASGELRGVDEASAAVALPPDPAVPASPAPHRGHPHHEGGGSNTAVLSLPALLMIRHSCRNNSSHTWRSLEAVSSLLELCTIISAKLWERSSQNYRLHKIYARYLSTLITLPSS